ncbi:hypothetical protein GSI_00437 [Ganoderma sinense ZZ0214-1]|uniref:Uncharacterized protein n=1 Tax=Ganoderma sinense ZZ0214-1 TaxID=1077348 RepID=A0A2G8ST55_9APHY|nr:hypothetical protein GSI_00437 [Ganoderma sinense ZZ0214-1]
MTFAQLPSHHYPATTEEVLTGLGASTIHLQDSEAARVMLRVLSTSHISLIFSPLPAAGSATSSRIFRACVPRGTQQRPLSHFVERPAQANLP